MATPAILNELSRLSNESNWTALAQRAKELAKLEEDATILAFAAHGLRKLGEIKEGYEYALRAAVADPASTFAQNRRSLLANLNGRYEAAYAAGEAVLDLPAPNASDAQNLANTIVNAIYAAHKLGKIAEAVETFTPIILRLDHHELHYNSGCLYALAGDERSFYYVRRALATGKKKSAFEEPDFDSIRSDPRFRELLARDWVAELGAINRASDGRHEPQEFYEEDDTELDVVYQRRQARRNAEAHRDADAVARAALRMDHFLDPEELRLAAFMPVDRRRDPAIEAAIDAAVDDPSGYLIYADWLLERDNPRGHLILASQRCAEARTESERMLAFTAWGALVAENARRWLGTALALITQRSRTQWFMGFITELVFDTGSERRPGDTAAELLIAALDLPVARFLRKLSLRDVFAGEGGLDYASVIAVVCDAELPHLRGLTIAPARYDLASTTLDASALVMPDLEELELAAADLTLPELAFPKLRRLAIIPSPMTTAILARILVASWPALEELELWFGRDAEVSHAELWRIFSGLAMPALRRLRLRDCHFADALVTSIASSAILPKLVELDLTNGRLTAIGVHTLVENAPRFRHLERIDLGGNAIDGDLAKLRAALPNAVVGLQDHHDYNEFDDFTG